MTPQAYQELARAIRGASGLVLGPDQDYLLHSRLAPMLRRRGLANLDELARRLSSQDGPTLLREVAEAVTTNETSFFRDDAPFRVIAEECFPALARTRAATTPLRIWSAACSSGQEAYSVAMLAASCLPGRRIEILGTDISSEMVLRAREALYTAFEVRRGLDETQLARWFRAEAGGWRAVPELRACCRFETANLLGELSQLGSFDLVLLRNVLIYFDPPTRERVIEACTRRLAPGGYLMLGATETLIGLRTRLTAVPGRRGLWRMG
jgi:chemotaxis protein methyltransferase CheR